MRAVSILIIALVCFQNFVFAHYQIIYPGTRGFDEGKEPVAPCGGFDTASSQRIRMPKSAFITINSGHTSYSYIVNALYNENPSAADFSGTNVNKLAEGSRKFPEVACLPVEFGSNIEDGTNATLQVVYNGGDGLLYQVSNFVYNLREQNCNNFRLQCIDVTIDNAANYNSSMCYNTDGSSTPIGSGGSPSTTPTNDTSKGSFIVATTGFTLIVALSLSALLAC